jgi:hypothetical protein
LAVQVQQVTLKQQQVVRVLAVQVLTEELRRQVRLIKVLVAVRQLMLVAVVVVLVLLV